MARVVLAMSGGVDSSASAYLLLQQGHEVIGLFMRSGVLAETTCSLEDPSALPIVTAPARKQGCCSASDAADARRVADALDIPFHALNFSDAFGRIQDYFADEYLAGRTPNPCVMCNNWLKFGRLWEFARQVGADFIASGHYAQIAEVSSQQRDERSEESQGRAHRSRDTTPLPLRGEAGRGVNTDPITLSRPLTEREGRFHAQPFEMEGRSGTHASATHALLRGRDHSKDQSYVLFGIPRELLPHILYPVGGHTKSEIRALAEAAGIRTAHKPDSQEICFIPDNNYAAFLERYRGPQETAGELVDTTGNVVGHHDGFQKFTIGQRRGLGVTFGEPRFVIRIEPETRRVVIGTKEDLGRRTLEADRLNWLVDDVPARCEAQIRYQHTPAACNVRLLDDDRMQVTFDEPQSGVAPGQAVVLYHGDRVLGGGWIR